MGRAHRYNSRLTHYDQRPPLPRLVLAPKASQGQAQEGGRPQAGKPRIVPMGLPHTWFPCAARVPMRYAEPASQLRPATDTRCGIAQMIANY